MRWNMVDQSSNRICFVDDRMELMIGLLTCWMAPRCISSRGRKQREQRPSNSHKDTHLHFVSAYQVLHKTKSIRVCQRTYVTVCVCILPSSVWEILNNIYTEDFDIPPLFPSLWERLYRDMQTKISIWFPSLLEILLYTRRRPWYPVCFPFNLPHGHACVTSKAIDYLGNRYYLRLEKKYNSGSIPI